MLLTTKNTCVIPQLLPTSGPLCLSEAQSRGIAAGGSLQMSAIGPVITRDLLIIPFITKSNKCFHYKCASAA